MKTYISNDIVHGISEYVIVTDEWISRVILMCDDCLLCESYQNTWYFSSGMFAENFKYTLCVVCHNKAKKLAGDAYDGL